jgi:hypothetical protein
MRDSDKLRDRAARLFALAVEAREDGKFLLANEISMLAAGARDHADDMDRRHQQAMQRPPPRFGDSGY